MSTPSQTEQVRTKVLYSEVDAPFNGYIDILGKVSKLANHVLNGKLQEHESEAAFQFNASYVNDLEQATDLRFLELQSSLDVKKIAQENWEQSNNDTIEYMETKLKDTIPELNNLQTKLRDRIIRIRELYESVSKVNTEVEVLLEGSTSLTATRSEWEEELGSQLTEKLIEQNYLRKSGTSDNEDKYRVYDNFTKGPKELKHINTSIRTDIDRLNQEVNAYKSKWMKDAEIFTRITSVLREELIKRDMNTNIDVEMDEEDEDQEEEANKDRYKRQRALEEEEEDEEDREEVFDETNHLEEGTIDENDGNGGGGEETQGDDVELEQEIEVLNNEDGELSSQSAMVTPAALSPNDDSVDVSQD